MNRRTFARGKPCQIRVPGYCNHMPETSVLCHYRLAGFCGTSNKPPDYFGAIGCSSCHDVVDERVKTGFKRDELRLMHAEGVMRTNDMWEKAGG